MDRAARARVMPGLKPEIGCCIIEHRPFANEIIKGVCVDVRIRRRRGLRVRAQRLVCIYICDVRICRLFRRARVFNFVIYVFNYVVVIDLLRH